MEFPYAPAILRQSAYPTKEKVRFDYGPREPIAQNVGDLSLRCLDVRPSARLVKVLDEQLSSLFTE